MPDGSAMPEKTTEALGGRRITWPSFLDLIRLRNQTGTLLLMLPTLWSLLLASEGRPSPKLVLIFTIGSFLMRSAGVIMNDLADRSFDRQVRRTSMRPLAAGAIGVREALVVLGLMLTVAAGLLAWLNPLTIVLSPVAVFLAAIYPFSKRLSHVPQAVLGTAFGWGVVMAWAAVQNMLPLPAWLLYAATICWAVAYDSIYALQDREDDVRIGVKSAAIFFGSRLWLAVGVSLLLMVALLALSGWLMKAGPIFYAVLIAVGGFFTMQTLALRRGISPHQALAMFKQHVLAGWAILIGIWLGFR
jgi:4-hydroxybenzoate polyprenyltransferase